jgi:hypothetical protein
MQNEPNFPRFSTKNDDKAKKQTQFKPNQSQLTKRPKMMQSFYLQRDKKINLNWGFVKTKPIKPNNQSSLILNHLEGKPNLLLSKVEGIEGSISTGLPAPACRLCAHLFRVFCSQCEPASKFFVNLSKKSSNNEQTFNIKAYFIDNTIVLQIDKDIEKPLFVVDGEG